MTPIVTLQQLEVVGKLQPDESVDWHQTVCVQEDTAGEKSKDY